MAKKKTRKPKKWMQAAAARMKKKGTEGSFTAWCKRHGFGGVNERCIAAALKKGGTIAKKAAFAKAARSVRKKKKKKKKASKRK